MQRTILSVALGLLLAGTASAQSMPLTTFVERGTALEKKGALAILSMGEINALQAEMQGAGQALKAEREEAEKGKRRLPYCPPKGQAAVKMEGQQLLAELRAIPVIQARRMTTTDGLRHMLIKRYPCR